MSDASTKQSVECPICGDEFDPTVAGGWCTNTECGEWQYTEPETDESDDGFVSPADDGTDDDDFVSPSEMDDESDEKLEPEDILGDESADADDSVGVDEESGSPDEDQDDVESDDDLAADADAAGGEDDGESDDDLAANAAEGEEDTEEAEPDVDDVAEPEADADADEADESVDADEEPDEPETIDCPGCGVELDAEANFCAECGADVADVSPGSEDSTLDACPSCGADVSPDDNFCVSCGEDLDAYREGGAGADAAEDDTDEAPAEVPDALVLEVEGREIDVDDGAKVGREIRAALMDAGRPEEEAVRIHREHVRFIRESDSYYLLDLGDNPTKLNGRTLTKGDREAITPGDELELSGVADVEIHSA